MMAVWLPFGSQAAIFFCERFFLAKKLNKKLWTFFGQKSLVKNNWPKKSWEFFDQKLVVQKLGEKSWEFFDQKNWSRSLAKKVGNFLTKKLYAARLAHHVALTCASRAAFFLAKKLLWSKKRQAVSLQPDQYLEPKWLRCSRWQVV